ncbi:20469_t:CDS:2, partial [Funneliformis geosporum]
GFLDLSDFVDLKELNTSNNHLNELNLTGCNSLQFIKCFNNEIIDTNFLWGFNEENLSRIDINCCNIQSTRLDVFSRFINLKELFIGNHVNNNKRAVKKLKKIEKGIYNRFYGSLEPLKNLTKLEYLSIVSTDINSGTEYLPKSLQKIDFSYVERPESRVKEIQKELTAFVYEIELEHVKSKLSGYNLFPYSRFSDHKFIAKGGFSKIYKVKFSLGNSNKDCYILKSLPLSLEDEKLFNEFANHRSLKYTIHCYGITQDLEGIRYLILDYCEHGNLRKFVKDNNLSSNDRFKILFSLAVSLNRIHSKGFLHKDFHPGNILVSSDEKGGHRTIISDLGTSVLLHNDKEGKIYGVLPYVAPEVLRKEPYIKASDIYSFGMIMYEILTENVNLPNELKELIRAQESIDFSKYEFQPLLETKQLHSSVSYYSKLINSDGVFNPTGLNNCQFDNLSLEDGGDSEEYFLIHKNLEKEIQNIKESLDSEITELVDKFIEIKKQSLKNREDKQIKKQVGEQKKQLKEKGLLEEKINKIIRYSLMVNNQIEFNNKYSKEIKEIKITDEYDFQGQLIIEDYLNLEKLHLQDIDSIDKIILKDLPRLENCIKKLNVRTNLLAKIQFLQFLQFLPNLEELELDGNAEISSGLEYLSSSLKTFTYENTKLTELLKPYQGKFQSLQKKISKLKEKQPITIDNSIDFEKKYQKLKGTLNFLIKEEEELKSKEIDALITDDLIESIKEQKNDLHKLQKTKKELEKQLVYFEQLLLIKRQKIEQKERGLEELKIAVKDKLNNEE